MPLKDGDQPVVFFDEEVMPQMLSVIEKAGVSIIFVTPYLELWNHLRTKIDKTLARKIDVKFVIRTETAAQNREAVDWLINHKVKVYEIDWLHAKIYLNEKTVLISSMNITKSSTSNARDFAMIVRNEVDEDKVRTYVLELINTAKPLRIESKKPASPPTQKPVNFEKKKIVRNEANEDKVRYDVAKNQIIEAFRTLKPIGQNSGTFNETIRQTIPHITRGTGTCIRCGESISFNPSRPLCYNCYSEWVEWENEDYDEDFCHQCGKPDDITYARPLCYSCFRS